MKTIRAIVISLLAMHAITVAVGVLAQTQEANRSAIIDEIIVTATKREANQQDLGLTVAAFSGYDIRDRLVDDLEGVIGLVPGAGFLDAAGGGIPIVIIRGVGLQNFRINDTPATAIYVDEVYQTSVAEAIAMVYDVERVEVLKGPQGGLYGRNAVGGAIQIISAKPDFEEFGGYTSFEYGRYDRVEFEGAFGGPISDTVAFRVAGKVITSDDTYFHSTVGNFDHGEEDRQAVRGLLEFTPSDNVDILFKVHGGDDKSELPLGHAAGFYQPLGLGLSTLLGVGDTADGAILNAQAATTSINNICGSFLAGNPDPATCETLNGMTPNELGFSSRYDSASLSSPALDNDWWGTSLQADVEFGQFTLTSISAVDSFDHGRYIDQDTMPEVHQEIDYNSSIEAWSQEFRLAFDNGDRLTGILGINYAEDELEEDSLLFTETGILTTQLGGLTRAAQQYVQTTEAFAVYGRSDWRFAQPFNLVLEARYTDEEKGFDGSTFLPQVSVTLASADETTAYDAFSGKIALEFFSTENSLLYISASRGFKSGGYFGGFATANAQLEPFDQETINGYEVGFKTDWPDSALRVNGSAFYYDREDVQGSGLDMSGIVNIARLTNVGDVESYGVEFEMVWTPIRQVSLQGGIAWLETEIVESDKTTSNLFRTSTSESFVGARIPNQPELSANFIARFEENVSSELVVGLLVDYIYRGEQDQTLVTNPLAGSFVTEDPYHLVNLRASIGSQDRQWTLSAYVANLFDETYRTNAGGTGPAGAVEIYGAPRTWAVGLDYEF